LPSLPAEAHEDGCHGNPFPVTNVFYQYLNSGYAECQIPTINGHSGTSIPSRPCLRGGEQGKLFLAYILRTTVPYAAKPFNNPFPALPA
jgi:hypothetical protein